MNRSHVRAVGLISKNVSKSRLLSYIVSSLAMTMENCDAVLPVGQPGYHFPIAISFKKHNVFFRVQSTSKQAWGTR